MIKAVVFDLDGTLVDSAPDICASANTLLRSLGLSPLPEATVRGFIGNGIPKLVERVMKATDIWEEGKKFAQLTDSFSEIYAAAPTQYSKLYPGVETALSTLQSDGFALGICTNKSKRLTDLVVAGLLADIDFGVVLGGDSLDKRKPDPLPLQTCKTMLNATQMIYVGDSEVDSATAVAARETFLLFTQGYRHSDIGDIAHTATFDSFNNLPDLISKHLK